MGNEIMANNLESVRKNTGKRKIHTASDEKSTPKKGAKKGAHKLKKKLAKRFDK